MDGSRRARRGHGRARPGSGALSLAQAEAELSDDVRRRLRAGSRAPEGWVPSSPEDARDGATREHTDRGDASHGDSSRGQLSFEETSRDENSRDDPGEDAARKGGTASTAARVRAALGDRMPVGLLGAHLAPSRRAVAGLAGLLVAALALALALTWLQRPSASLVPSVRRSVPAGAVVSLPPTATPAPDVVVDVIGAVRRPGLVELPGGSRVDDAVAAAGGARQQADLASVNLARVLVDGEQIVVLRKGARDASGTPGSATGGPVPSDQPVDLNSATLEQLDGLPGVGPVLAKRIIDWRAAHGRFSSVDDLTEVSGIGERTLADLRPLVRV